MDLGTTGIQAKLQLTVSKLSHLSLRCTFLYNFILHKSPSQDAGTRNGVVGGESVLHPRHVRDQRRLDSCHDANTGRCNFQRTICVLTNMYSMQSIDLLFDSGREAVRLHPVHNELPLPAHHRRIPARHILAAMQRARCFLGPHDWSDYRNSQVDKITNYLLNLITNGRYF